MSFAYNKRHLSSSLAFATDKAATTVRQMLIKVITVIWPKTNGEQQWKSDVADGEKEDKGCEDLTVSDEEQCSKYLLISLFKIVYMKDHGLQTLQGSMLYVLSIGAL